MVQLVQLTYSSVATQPFTRAEILDLLTEARRNNHSLGITGMLLYAEESFFQVLEGSPESVDEVYNRIARDPRHTQVTEILKEQIVKRDFADWTMGHAELSLQETEAIIGANDFFTKGESFAHLRTGRAKKLLQAFKTGRWRSCLTDDPNPGFTQQLPRHHFEPVIGMEGLPTARGLSYTFAFQPIVDVSSMTIFSFEALIRGPGNEPAGHILKRVPPAQIHRFDEQSRLLAIKLAAQLEITTRLNLNFMPRSTETSPEALNSMLDTAAKFALQPGQIIIEILEREIISDFDSFNKVIDDYRGAGIIFAIDDFGSGYAGLNLLAEFQPNLIKLDMQLVRDIHYKGPRQAIIRGIQRTCEDLGIDIIAEGVETVDEYRWLSREGIHLFQGNLIAPPSFESLTTTFDIPR